MWAVWVRAELLCVKLLLRDYWSSSSFSVFVKPFQCLSLFCREMSGWHLTSWRWEPRPQQRGELRKNDRKRRRGQRLRPLNRCLCVHVCVCSPFSSSLTFSSSRLLWFLFYYQPGEGSYSCMVSSTGRFTWPVIWMLMQNVLYSCIRMGERSNHIFVVMDCTVYENDSSSPTNCVVTTVTEGVLAWTAVYCGICVFYCCLQGVIVFFRICSPVVLL